MGWRDWTGVGERRWKKAPDEELRPAKTLWDWLQLLIVPAILVGVTFAWSAAQTRSDNAREDRRIAADRAAAEQVRQDTTLNDYFEQMSELMLNKKLLSSNEGDAVRSVARTVTLTALRRLDGERKGEVVRFLDDAGLIRREHLGYDLDGEDVWSFPVVYLGTADLTRADLRGADLRGAGLLFTDLRGADLRGADLGRAFFHGADFRGADLREAQLGGADLLGANLSRSNLARARLRGADLEQATLTDANLTGANLRAAKLGRANLTRANLREANLTWADLMAAKLTDAKLTGANLKVARLLRANLTRANLRGAHLTDAVLTNANLKDADLTGADLTNANFDGAKGLPKRRR